MTKDENEIILYREARDAVSYLQKYTHTSKIKRNVPALLADPKTFCGYSMILM